MIIKYYDGTEDDTTKMDDNTAELMERTKEYLDFCCSRNIAVYCKFYNSALHEHSGFHNFNKDNKDFEIVLSYVIRDLQNMTGKKMKLVEDV